MELAQAAKPLGVRTIVGAEVTLDDGHHLTLPCEDRTGYGNLCRLITRAHEGTRDRPADPVPPTVTLDDVERHASGLVCLTGCARHGSVAGRIDRDRHAEAAAVGRRLVRAVRGRRLPGGAQRPLAPRGRRL